MPIPTVEERVETLLEELSYGGRKNHLDDTLGMDSAREIIRTILTQDRQAFAEAIVKALRGMIRPEAHNELCDGYCETWGCVWPDIRASNKTLDQAIATIKSTYQSSK